MLVSSFELTEKWLLHSPSVLRPDSSGSDVWPHCVALAFHSFFEPLRVADTMPVIPSQCARISSNEDRLPHRQGTAIEIRTLLLVRRYSSTTNPGTLHGSAQTCPRESRIQPRATGRSVVSFLRLLRSGIRVFLCDFVTQAWENSPATLRCDDQGQCLGSQEGRQAKQSVSNRRVN